MSEHLHDPNPASTPPLDRRAARRQETKAEIVAAAWELVRENGLAGLSMRDLGRSVGLRASSLYSYFESKHEIYDAMFQEGYTTFAAMAEDLPAESSSDPVDVIQERARQFFSFCTSDPVRYQLLFQRTIPGFEPSAASWEVALGAYTAMADEMAGFGITEPAALDLWTALLTGLTSQQISNDPDGDRWERLVAQAVVMALREIAPHLITSSKGQHQ